MAEIQIVDGYDPQRLYETLPCEDGGGRMPDTPVRRGNGHADSAGSPWVSGAAAAAGRNGNQFLRQRPV